MIKLIFLLILFVSCRETVPDKKMHEVSLVVIDEKRTDSARPAVDTTFRITAEREAVVSFAKLHLGVPYKYASSDPEKGFDCSGFITYVYNHFNEVVPRSSVEFTNLGREVQRDKARAGDLILFTGTDSSDRTVGHMGIVVENSDSLRFIHSTSGRAWGVTITALNEYYSGRFVKVVDMY